MHRTSFLSGRFDSFRCAGRGISNMLRTQHNARLHAVATVVVTMAGWLLAVTRDEWCLLVLAMMAVWTAEALNTALELLCDVASPEFHPLVEQAKDVAELEAQWNDPGYWEAVQGQVPRIDELIDGFNDAVGLLGEGS